MELTQELVKELFDYDNGNLFWKIKKTRINIGDKAGTISKRENGNRNVIMVNRKNFFASRLIFLWHNGYLPEKVDHRDRDCLNDRIDNLRAATSSQNGMNIKSHRDSTSKYVGVCFHEVNRKWTAFIRINGRHTYLGSFKTEEEAAMVRNDAAKKILWRIRKSKYPVKDMLH